MICAMILAAGRSQRMGTQKLLLPLGDRPVIACVVDEVLRSPVDRVFVVIAPDGSLIAEALAGRRVEFVANPDPESEMLASVRCGLRATPQDCAAALVVPGDHPGVTAEVISSLIEAFEAGARGIVVPAYNGRRGHPLLLSMRYRNEILTRYDDTGLRGLLRAHAGDVHEVEVPTAGVVEDMDLPEDYVRIREHLRGTQ
jgi:molybdenum cofactor cytidylyltransferase